MSDKVAKRLKDETLRTKFKPGMIVVLTRHVTDHMMTMTDHRVKGQPPRPCLARVLSAGDRQVGNHRRFAVDLLTFLGKREVWEEWVLARLCPATPDQTHPTRMPTYLA